MGTCVILSLLPAPLVGLALFLMLRYKSRSGKFGLFYKTFLLGLAGVVPVYLVDNLIYYLHLDSLHSLHRTLFYAFVLTGGVFELCKFIVLKLTIYPSKQVTKPFDVLFYSVVIAAGFTTSYSVYALFFAPAYISLCLYAITIAPAFVSIAMIMGYFNGIALIRRYPIIDMFTGLFLAAIFQGIYRFCLLYSDELLLFMATGGMLIIGITLMVLSLRDPSESD
ncbi:MAG: PrsW family glutamic-type intramembrane protease [Bacteroidota bacterium]